MFRKAIIAVLTLATVGAWFLGSLSTAMLSAGNRRGEILPLVISWIPCVVFGTSLYAILVIPRRRRRRRREQGLCIDCGYDLTGNVTGLCSECGRPIKEGDATVGGS